jgi:hypothetical protein
MARYQLPLFNNHGDMGSKMIISLISLAEIRAVA